MIDTKIIVATHNAHKLSEIRAILGANFDLVSLHDIGFLDEIIESGSTFHDNAKIKSDTLFERFGCNILADDSGLEIEALNGEPGVFSSRYAGPDCIDENNMEKVLNQLKGSKNRVAQFRTVLSLKWNGKQYFFEGVVRGTISELKRGENGFGYDPIFIPNGFDKSFAEMTSFEKNKLSHRFKALQRLKQFLENEIK